MEVVDRIPACRTEVGLVLQRQQENLEEVLQVQELQQIDLKSEMQRNGKLHRDCAVQ